jgi:hypothetical protein
VQELILITENSPWCTIVKNEVGVLSVLAMVQMITGLKRGVTLGDICTTIWKEYVLSGVCHRTLTNNFDPADIRTTLSPMLNSGPSLLVYRNISSVRQHTPSKEVGTCITPQPPRPTATGELVSLFSSLSAFGTHHIIDWLRERVYFEGFVKQDQYAISRLGFKAPNIFCMQLTS